MPRIGIDLGGTKIEGIVLADDGAIESRRRVPTPAGDYAATIDTVAALVLELERDCDVRCTVGVGTPGALSPATGRMRNANSTCLNGQPLDADLGQRLRRRVRIANDADCFTLSEARDGAARGATSVFGVIIGTGTGGGIVIDGRLLQGPNAIAGEWGHNPLPWMTDAERPGPPCYCGKHGCVETFLSGPGMAHDYATATAAASSRAAVDIVERALAGEIAAGQCLARYHDRLARALASVINLLDPEVIVLGGGLSNIDSLYIDVPARLPRYVFSDVVRTRLVRAEYGDSSGVRGAAWLWGVEENERGLPAD
ncbi:MAG: ROK family protein [Gammaproteobacteria bacterium]|nr:ROK family protein [Gammaproteobacteria bacterium]